MTKANSQRKPERIFIFILTISFFISLAMHVHGVPQGANIISNLTEGAPTNPPGSRADDGGTIVVLNLDITQQNDAWKAYVGNVSGRLTLDDASGNTIYDWSIAASSIQGEVYVSRNDSVTWSNVSCANTTIISAEESLLNMIASDVDSLSNTFNYTAHVGMQVGVNTILNNTCSSTATYINDTVQAVHNQSNFQEILLQDEASNLIYATTIDQDAFSYKNETNHTYDFQLLVGEDDQAASGTTYYFYLEIGS